MRALVVALLLGTLVAVTQLGSGAAVPIGTPGTIGTFAGGGVGDGGAPDQAALQGRAAFAPNGDMYIADGCAIRKVSGDVVTTVAGRLPPPTPPNPNWGCTYSNYIVGESATDALFVTQDVRVNADAVVYARIYPSRILQISGGIIAADFAGSAMALDASGDLYAAQGCTVVKLTGPGAGTVAGAPQTDPYCQTQDGEDGNALLAHITPDQIAIGSNGDLFIGGGCTLSVVHAGVINRIGGAAGSCESTGNGGPVLAATFVVSSFALNSQGDLILGDACRIRKISGGAISTIAGLGKPNHQEGCTFSGDGGPATAADLSGRMLALDHEDNIYMGDSCPIRVIHASTGIIGRAFGATACVAPGDGVSLLNASIPGAQSIAVAPDGTMYLAEGCVVRMIRDGVIARFAGNGAVDSAEHCITDSGDGEPARDAAVLAETVAVAPNGDVYFGGACRLRRVHNGILTTVAGTDADEHHFGCALGGDGGPAIDALLSVGSIATAPNGDIYVGDRGHCRIRKISAGMITTYAGGHGTSVAASPFARCPFDLTSGNDDGGLLAASLDPAGLAFGPDGTLYVADQLNCRVRAIRDNAISTVAGTTPFDRSDLLPGKTLSLCRTDPVDGDAKTKAISPVALVVDPRGDIFFADRYGFVEGACSIRKISNGAITRIAGTLDMDSCRTLLPLDDGAPANDAEFDIAGLAADAAGNLYFGDRRHARVRIVYGVAAAQPEPTATPTATATLTASETAVTTRRTATATPAAATATPVGLVPSVAVVTSPTRVSGVLPSSSSPRTTRVLLPNTGQSESASSKLVLAIMILVGCAMVAIGVAGASSKRRS